MKIIIFVNNSVDWQSMTEEKFMSQKLSWPVQNIWPLIETWNQLFQIKYFEFRKKMHEIAVNNWSFCDSIARSDAELLKELESSPADTIVLPTDDDDWYHPQFKDLIGPINHDIVHWKPAQFQTGCTLDAPGRKAPKIHGGIFNYDQRRPLFTNNWLITKPALTTFTKKQRYKLQINKTACDFLSSFKHQAMSTRLNLANKSVASSSNLANCKGIEQILDTIFSDRKNLKIPADYTWAKPYINELISLYGKTIGK